jgi:hypothetical protein
MGTGGPFPGGKERPGRDAELSAKVENEQELYLLSSKRLNDRHFEISISSTGYTPEQTRVSQSIIRGERFAVMLNRISNNGSTWNPGDVRMIIYLGLYVFNPFCIF